MQFSSFFNAVLVQKQKTNVTQVTFAPLTEMPEGLLDFNETCTARPAKINDPKEEKESMIRSADTKLSFDDLSGCKNWLLELLTVQYTDYTDYNSKPQHSWILTFPIHFFRKLSEIVGYLRLLYWLSKAPGHKNCAVRPSFQRFYVNAIEESHTSIRAWITSYRGRK